MTGVEIIHEIIFENGCCDISGKMVEIGKVQLDSLGEKYLCSDHSKIYRIHANDYNYDDEVDEVLENEGKYGVPKPEGMVPNYDIEVNEVF